LIQNGTDAKRDMDAFLQAQRERFSCESCGSIIDQHHQKCSECGKNDE
jgi:ribosomal protein L37AE/L43A